MSASVFNQVVKSGAVSLAALCLALGGSAYAGDGPIGDYTSVSKASVNIKYYEQTGEGVAESGKVKTNDVINTLTGAEPGSKVPRNLKLVMLSYCGDPEYFKALGVWDKDQDALTGGVACLYPESAPVYDDKKNLFYQGLDIEAGVFGMHEIDMDVQVKTGSVRKRVNSDEPICLKSFKTLTMAGYYNGEGDHKVLRKGKINTSGSVQATLEGNVVGICD